MNKIKLCKDCKYFVQDDLRPQCTKQQMISSIDGKPERHWRMSAWLQREDGVFGSWVLGTCGKRARYFEVKA